MPRRRTAPTQDGPSLFELTPVQPSTEPLVAPIEHAIWTESKARLIARYLRFFVYVTKHGTYIDAFAGPQYLNKPEAWAAKLVLETEPRWLRHFYLFEKRDVSRRRLDEMVAALEPRRKREPQRTISVHPGDSNVVLQELLRARKIPAKDATFCLLDQRTFECAWETVKAVATYKTEGHKIELFYFFASGWLGRAMAASKRPEALGDVDAWWGRSDWPKLREMNSFDQVTTMVGRVRDELGYKSVKAWPILARAHSGRLLYFMVHATDHPLAPGLMRRAYGQAVTPMEPLEQMKIVGLELREAFKRAGY